MLNFCVSATSSNSGKTILTTALLYHYKNSVRPFKIGPDFIDPQFHKKVCGSDSINLDTFMMDKSQVKWLYAKYSDKEVSICEGVMGFYDGEDKGCSTYSVSKLLEIPVILILDCKGSYITISAILQGLKGYRDDNTIKGVVLNHINSSSHYELIKNIIESDHQDIKVLGWIKKDLSSLQSRHLGLDLKELFKIDEVSKAVLENIDISLLESIAKRDKRAESKGYPFEKIKMREKHLAVVYDENFSFLYADNLEFFKEVFKKVSIIDATKDEEIPKSCDVVFICGGYVESDSAYAKIKHSKKFKNSLILHAKTKKIYGECAGFLYLGKMVDDKEMSAILDVEFSLEKRFQRLGYYYNEDGIKGHAFHYTKIKDEGKCFDLLSKTKNGSGKFGSCRDDKNLVFGTYLHTMFRVNPTLLQ